MTMENRIKKIDGIAGYDYEGKIYKTVKEVLNAIQKNSEFRDGQYRFVEYWDSGDDTRTIFQPIDKEGEPVGNCYNVYHGKRGGLNFCEN